MEGRSLIIDIEENGGTHTVVWRENGRQMRDEVYTFANSEDAFCGHKIWDLEAIFSEIKKGIAAACEQYPDINDAVIKTWNYDYVLMRGDMELLPCYSYRDNRISELDERGCGCKTEEGTMSQLLVDMNHGRLKVATDILMMPEYFVYKLTGVKTREYRRSDRGRRLNLKPEIAAELGRNCKVAVY